MKSAYTRIDRPRERERERGAEGGGKTAAGRKVQREEDAGKTW